MHNNAYVHTTYYPYMNTHLFSIKNNFFFNLQLHQGQNLDQQSAEISVNCPCSKQFPAVRNKHDSFLQYYWQTDETD